MGAEKGDNKQLQYKASTRKNDSILGKLGACCEKPHNERSISSPCCKPGNIYKKWEGRIAVGCKKCVAGDDYDGQGYHNDNHR